MIYGHSRTIHRTGHIDVVVKDGHVTAVWFRCLQLPFQEHNTPNVNHNNDGLREIVAIEVKD